MRCDGLQKRNNELCLHTNSLAFLFLCWTTFGYYFSTKTPLRCSVRIPFILNPFRCRLLFIKMFLNLVINHLLTSLARDCTGRISALSLFCTDLAALGPYCEDLGPIFSQCGPRAWSIRCIHKLSITESSTEWRNAEWPGGHLKLTSVSWIF